MDNRPTKSIMCRYYALGQCNRGSECPFSHDNSHKPSEICKFYQTGNCAFKDKCLFKHVLLPKYQEIKEKQRNKAKTNDLSAERQINQNKKPSVHVSSDDSRKETNKNADCINENSEETSPVCQIGNNNAISEENQFELFSKIMNISITDDDRESGIRDMTKRSQDLECSICLENVLGHYNVNKRTFGLLENCAHIFCLHCIRDWRSRKNTQLDYALACPICRAKSNFVTPSRYFPDTQEEKYRVILDYRHELKKIHCHYFNRGRSKCPFSTSCFYRHEFLDGTLATDKQLVLNSDGVYEIYSQYNEDGDPFSELYKAFADPDKF